MKNKPSKIIITPSTARKRKVAIARALNINVSTIHKTWKVYEEQRRADDRVFKEYLQ